jgi:hypothetical protein
MPLCPPKGGTAVIGRSGTSPRLGPAVTETGAMDCDIDMPEDPGGIIPLGEWYDWCIGWEYVLFCIYCPPSGGPAICW